MLRKNVIVCLAATAFAASALMATGASAAGGRGGAAANVPQPGTWNWPPYAEGGNMPRSTCGYVLVNPYHYKVRNQGRWVYQCR
jgi:hypothetical protein